MSGLFRAPADVVKPRIAAATLKAAGIADKKRINESGIKQTVATFDVKLKSAPSADSGAVLAPRGCVTNLSRTLLRLLLLLACSPLQIIQCQRPEFFGDARRAALTCKQCAPLGALPVILPGQHGTPRHVYTPGASTHLELRINRISNRRGLRFPVSFP